MADTVGIKLSFVIYISRLRDADEEFIMPFLNTLGPSNHIQTNRIVKILLKSNTRNGKVPELLITMINTDILVMRHQLKILVEL